MIIHILHMYNSKHPRTWDESLPYVQHSYNRALHKYIGHNPFQVGLGFQPLFPIDVSIPFVATLVVHLTCISTLKGLTTSLSGFNTSSNRSMIYSIELILSTRNTMINIERHTSSRWETNFGYICRRSAMLDLTTRFTLFYMGHTPSRRSLLIMPSSSTSHHSLACT